MKYKVRFQPQPEPSVPCSPTSQRSRPAPQQPPGGSGATRSDKSRRGCRECKSRKVKCDDTHPACLRCQRRGSACHPGPPPPARWQLETPGTWLARAAPAGPWAPAGAAVRPEGDLMGYWLGEGCRMLSLARAQEGNPFSLPLVEHLVRTPSLVHAVQSVSAGQRVSYRRSSLQKCLSERGLAMRALRSELCGGPGQVGPASVLTVFLLGISASWAEDEPRCYGREHMAGARALLGRALADTRGMSDPLIRLVSGWYLYWDMAISLVEGPDEDDMSGMSSLHVCTAIEISESSFHPMIGFSGKLFYLLACLHRHCRRVLQGGPKDPYLEDAYKRQLLAWEPRHEDKDLVGASLAFRNHGLIMLSEICGCSVGGDGRPGAGTDLVARRAVARETLEIIFETPLDAPCIHSHSIPLLTAGAQLLRDDSLMRVKVVDRFRGLFSASRLMINMWAIQLLEELWLLRDSGAVISWLDLLLSKNWTLNFA